MTVGGGEQRPYGSFNFRVVVGEPGREIHGVCEVVFPDFPLRAPATRRTTAEALEASGPLVLRRGSDGTQELYDWWNEARRSKKPAARTVSVELLDENRAPVTRWTFTGCRPRKLAYSPLDARVSAVLIETLELSFERFELR